jgi:hypothetical protein
MRMGIGLGVGINRSNYAQGIFSAYQSRVIADGGVTEAGACVDAVSSLLQSASLLLIPSGYKSGKAYAEIPTNGNGDLTWTRASDAWRTNAEGLIQRVPWNLASYSEDFSNAAWTLDGVTISANQIASPTGTTTADLMTSNGTGQQRIFQVYTVSANSPYTISIYVKQGTTSTIQIVMPYVGAGPTFTFSTATFNTVSGWTSSVETLANGWYRISVTNTPTTTQAGFQLVLPSNGSTVYLWGAQFNQGSSAQTYFPTTDRLNVPRLSYMYGSCPALLLEPQRTNLALHSEQFDNAYWSKLGTTTPTITANATTSPDGTTNADLLTGTGGVGQRLQRAITVATSTAYSVSIYVKANTATSAQLNIYDGATDRGGEITFSTGAVTTSGSGVSATSQNIGNGWFRFVINYTSFATTSINVQFGVSGSTSYYLWGSQFEQGAYSTTYIPTTTASATRIADSFSRSNIYTNGLITSSGGTWFLELRGNVAYTRDAFSNGLRISDSSSTVNNGLEIRNGATIPLIITKRIAGASTTLIGTVTSRTKLAIKWNGSTCDVFLNGVKEVAGSSFTTTNMEFLIGGAEDVPKFIQAMGLHPTPLTDAQCIEITTL